MIGRQWVLLKINIQIHKEMSMRDTLNINPLIRDMMPLTASTVHVQFSHILASTADIRRSIDKTVRWGWCTRWHCQCDHCPYLCRDDKNRFTAFAAMVCRRNPTCRWASSHCHNNDDDDDCDDDEGSWLWMSSVVSFLLHRATVIEPAQELRQCWSKNSVLERYRYNQC